jgi:hypothetical protein
MFNSPIAYQVLQPAKEEAMVTMAQMNVEEVNESTSDGTQQSTQMGSLNIDHENQESTKELNMLLLNTPKIIVNSFGTIDWVTKEGWPRIPRRQADGKSMKI